VLLAGAMDGKLAASMAFWSADLLGAKLDVTKAVGWGGMMVAQKAVSLALEMAERLDG
jgi:hypothetical protein